MQFEGKISVIQGFRPKNVRINEAIGRKTRQSGSIRISYFIFILCVIKELKGKYVGSLHKQLVHSVPGVQISLDSVIRIQSAITNQYNCRYFL